MDAATSAEMIAESAQSAGDWQLAIARWQEAIGLLKRVPSSSSYHVIAQPKIAQYQRQLGVAQQKATRPGAGARQKLKLLFHPELSLGHHRPPQAQHLAPNRCNINTGCNI
jgi:hypothetical protein